MSIIHICCGIDSYNRIKELSKNQNIASFVFLGYSDEKLSGSIKSVSIEPAYFARYMSPFRDDYGQGPILLPFRAMEKLILRTYEKNVLKTYMGLLDVLNDYTDRELQVFVQCQAETDSTYCFDILTLLHAAAKYTGKTIQVSLCVHLGLAAHYLPFINEERERNKTAFIEEITYYEDPAVYYGDKRIHVGSFIYTGEYPLYNKIIYYSDGRETERPAIQPDNYRYSKFMRGWPYFHECVWDNINYDGFVAEPRIVQEIHDYEKADKDSGTHLYVKGRPHWIL